MEKGKTQKNKSKQQEEFKTFILNQTKAKDVAQFNQKIQSLWSGYGEVVKISLKNPCDKIVQNDQSNGFLYNINSKNDVSHLRKLQSYGIEKEFYSKYSEILSKKMPGCKVPKVIGLKHSFLSQLSQEWIFLLEDLDASGYPKRLQELCHEDYAINAVIKWLANFHIAFLMVEPKGLWEVGTYWHLNTRLEEHSKIQEKDVKQWAHKIDEKLNNAKYKTIVHGDAKIANFCFSKCHKQVAGVDFQYIGGGIGVKDLAYFIGSCIEEKDCWDHHDKLKEQYFTELEIAFNNCNVEETLGIQFVDLKNEWDQLYKYCWADFYRFLLGWNPDQWKVNSFHKHFTDIVIQELKQEQNKQDNKL